MIAGARVVWVDPRAKDDVGRAASADAIKTLVRGTPGVLPVIVPRSNGLQRDGSIKFTDHRGYIVYAQIGDEIEVTQDGWVLHPAAK